jgi:hypothetical protein
MKGPNNVTTANVKRLAANAGLQWLHHPLLYGQMCVVRCKPLQYKEKEQSLKSDSKKHANLNRTQRLHSLFLVGSNRLKTKI